MHVCALQMEGPYDTEVSEALMCWGPGLHYPAGEAGRQPLPGAPNTLVMVSGGIGVSHRCFGKRVSHRCFGKPVSHRCFGKRVSHRCFGKPVSHRCFGTRVSHRCFGTRVSYVRANSASGV